MDSFQEAMQELRIGDNVSPREKLRAACLWHLGYPDWAGQFILWAVQAGYVVEGDD